jgi:hypothetical protein
VPVKRKPQKEETTISSSDDAYWGNVDCKIAKIITQIPDPILFSERFNSLCFE